MRYIGVDYGTKKVGVAISDEQNSFAFPKIIIDTNEALNELSQIIKEENISAVVIGESVASNGSENKFDEDIKNFSKKLEQKTGVKIFFQREDFSSVEAHRYQTKKGDRDDSAAAIILQRFLDKKSMTK